jgi:hypothetical protein
MMSIRRLITEGLRAAVRFLPVAWAGTWGALGIAACVLGLSWAFGLWSVHSAWRWPSLATSLAVVVMAQGGLYRQALASGAPGPAGLQWGMAECRLSAVWLLTAIFLSVLGMLAFVVVLSFAFAIASSGKGFVTALPMTWARGVDGRGRMVMAVVAALCMVGLTWSAMRVSLAAAATVARGRLQVLASWPTTRGVVWPIIIGKAILAAAPVGFAILVMTIGKRLAGVPWGFGLAAGAALAAIWLPLNAGLMAFFYQRASAP